MEWHALVDFVTETLLIMICALTGAVVGTVTVGIMF